MGRTNATIALIAGLVAFGCGDSGSEERDSGPPDGGGFDGGADGGGVDGGGAEDAGATDAGAPDAGPRRFESGHPAGTAIDGLEDTEYEALCEAASAFVRRAEWRHDPRVLACRLRAIASTPSERICQVEAYRCMERLDEDLCDPAHRGDCAATIGDLEDCIDALPDHVDALLGEVRCSAAGTPGAADAFALVPDACTALVDRCAPLLTTTILAPVDPTCDNGERDEGEADVDCGGGCPACDVGSPCAEDDDCATGHCVIGAAGGSCVATASCLSLLGEGATRDDAYVLDPDGDGALEPFASFCDMTTDGGGFTLIMKLANTGPAVFYDSPLWETEELLREDDLVPNRSVHGRVAKFPGFNHVTGSAIHLQWLDPEVTFPFDGVLGGDGTALTAFRGDEQRLAGGEDDGCNGELLESAPAYDATVMRFGRGHQFFGLNGHDTGISGTEGRARLGYASNDEQATAWSAQNGVSVFNSGGEATVFWTGITDEDCGGAGETECGCYGERYVPAPTCVNVWVR